MSKKVAFRCSSKAGSNCIYFALHSQRQVIYSRRMQTPSEMGPRTAQSVKEGLWKEEGSVAVSARASYFHSNIQLGDKCRFAFLNKMHLPQHSAEQESTSLSSWANSQGKLLAAEETLRWLLGIISSLFLKGFLPLVNVFSHVQTKPTTIGFYL